VEQNIIYIFNCFFLLYYIFGDITCVDDELYLLIGILKLFTKWQCKNIHLMSFDVNSLEDLVVRDLIVLRLASLYLKLASVQSGKFG